jgi:hypothetical protein
MEQNLIHASLSPGDIATINDAIETISTKLNFLVSLSGDEKSELFKVGKVYNTLLDIAVRVVEQYPQIMSGTFNVAEFKSDYELAKSLEPIYTRLLPLFKALEDSVTAAKSDALVSTLDVYAEVKSHLDKIPGLEAIYNEMKEYFPRKRAQQTKSAPQN